MSVTIYKRDLTVLETILYYEKEIRPKRAYKSYTFHTKEGEITLLDDKDCPLDKLILYRIYLFDHCQRKGILTNLIRYFQEQTEYKEICICAAEGPVVHCVRKINNSYGSFYNQGGDFVWIRNK